MKKKIVASSLALFLFGCGSSTSSTTVGGPDPETPTTDVSDVLTDVSRDGYNAYDSSIDSKVMGQIADFPVPASAGDGKTWKLDSKFSDDFDYTFIPHAEQTTFGHGDSESWINFYHNGWDGPGSTYWKHEQIEVKEGNLLLHTKRSERTDKQDKPGTNTGCLSSNGQVQWPVYVEASISMADVSLTTAVWLLAPDDTQEIDILEAYAGAGENGGNDYFSKKIHLSHHSFIRDPFTDYQPKDAHTWWQDTTPGDFNVQETSWGEYSWNGGDRQYIQIGVNWVDPHHFEYYINGELVRVVYYNAVATKMDNVWFYNYPEVNEQGEMFVENGFHVMTTFKESAEDEDFDFVTLQDASAISPSDIVDPGNFQDGAGMNKAADIIINMEYQDWWKWDVPTDAELEAGSESGKTSALIDWIRVYKPVDETATAE